jgi:hypothetical protein
MTIFRGLAAILNDRISIAGYGVSTSLYVRIAVTKFNILLVAFLLALGGCKCTPTGPELSVDVITKAATLDNVFTIGSGNTLFGFDSLSGALKVKVRFNTKDVITYGSKSSDGRVFFSNSGRVGAWANTIVVLDKDCNIAKQISTVALPSLPVAIHDKLFVGSGSLSGDAVSPMQVFDLNNYNLLFSADNIEGEIAPILMCFDDKFAYASIGAANSSKPERKNYFIKFDLSTLDTTRLYAFSLTYPDSLVRTTPMLDGGSLICLYFRNHLIEKYDLQTGAKLASQSFNQPELVPQANMLSVAPVVNGNGSYSILFVSDFSTPVRQIIANLNQDDLSLISSVTLDATYHIDYNRVAFCGAFVISAVSGEGATVFNRATGALVAHYDE